MIERLASRGEDVLMLPRIWRAVFLIGWALWPGINTFDQPGKVGDREEGAIASASGYQSLSLIVTFDHMGLGDFLASFDGETEHGRAATHDEYGRVLGQHMSFATEKPGRAIDRYDLAVPRDCTHVSAMRRG